MIVAEMRLLLLLEIVLRWRVGPGKVGGGGRVGEVSPAAALGVQGPVVRHGLALRQRRRRRRDSSAPVQRFSVVVVLLLGPGAAAESEHGAEVPQQLVGAPFAGGGAAVDSLCR